MFAMLRTKPRTSCLLGRPCTAELEPQAFLILLFSLGEIEAGHSVPHVASTDIAGYGVACLLLGTGEV